MEKKEITADQQSEEEAHSLQIFYDHVWETDSLYVYKIKFKDTGDIRYFVMFYPGMGPTLLFATAGKEYDSLKRLLSDYKNNRMKNSDSMVCFVVGEENGKEFEPSRYVHVDTDKWTLLPIDIKELERIMGEKAERYYLTSDLKESYAFFKNPGNSKP